MGIVAHFRRRVTTSSLLYAKFAFLGEAMDDALSAWRTREGTAFLACYGALIVAVSAVVGFGVSEHIVGGAPLWARLLPIVLPGALVAGVLLIPPFRPYAYRLQLLNIGSFMTAVLVHFAHKGGGSPGAALAVVTCMFAVQYAFLRWQELVSLYAGVLCLYVALASLGGTLFTPNTVQTGELYGAVAAVCVVLGLIRLRSIYAAETERLALERQTAELRRQTERNARMAFTDQMTGLLNRSGINDLIDRALVLAKKTSTFSALLYIDLDGFKQVNDVCGHDAGDLALVEAALRIQYHLRRGETAGRIGGDEFVVVLPCVQSIEEPRALAKRLEEAFVQPFISEGRMFTFSASIGIAMSGRDGETRLELLHAADRAMYGVKNAHKRENVVHIGTRGA
jgi:diguanylate cyclase (GGDEF)-like protein